MLALWDSIKFRKFNVRVKISRVLLQGRSFKEPQDIIMVVYSKEMPRVCRNCEMTLETAFFRCADCGDVVSCKNCDPRSSYDEEDPSSEPLGRSFCPRGGYHHRGRGFHDNSSHHFRGTFAPGGRQFCPRPESPHDRRNFMMNGPFPRPNRGFGFGPRGFHGFPPRCPFPEEFSPMMRGRGGFGPFAGAPRGRAGFSPRCPFMEGARGRGGCRSRGGMQPFCGARGMGCGECNHVVLELVRVNTNGPSFEPCQRANGSQEKNTQVHEGEQCSGEGSCGDEENIPDNSNAMPCNIDPEG